MKKRIIVLTIAIIIIITIFLPVNTQHEEQFSAYSKKWNDISKFREDMKKEGYKTNCIVSNPMILKDWKNPKNTLFVVIGVEKEYSPFEMESIIDFLHDGGKTIIADDFGYANSLSKEITKSLSQSQQFSVTFYKEKLWDDNYDTNLSFPIVNTSINNVPFKILLNEPTGLIIDGKTNVIANSSKKSFIDLNGNNQADLEEKGPIPIIVKARVGEGTVVFISDSGLFTNDLWNKKGYDNAKFTKTLIQSLLISENGKDLNEHNIVFDESRHQEQYTNKAYQVIDISILLTTNPMIRALFLITIIIILFCILITIKGKENWSHKFDLSLCKARTYPNTIEWQQNQLRQIILRKAGLDSKMSVPDINRLDINELSKRIKDPILINFIFTKKHYSEHEIMELLGRIQRW